MIESYKESRENVQQSSNIYHQSLEIPVIETTHHLCMKDVLYEVRCLKSNEDMILALTGQFKQLSHEPEKFR